MSDKRVAVLFRTYFWDDFAFRSALRVWQQAEGLDFYVQADETSSGPLQVGPFRKISHTIDEFEQIGLPAAGPAHRAPMWWNCDYALTEVGRKLPGYDYYLWVEADVAVNLPLRPLVQQVIASGAECMTARLPKPIGHNWPRLAFCVDMPYRQLSWVTIPVIMLSRRAADYLLQERRRLARLYAERRLAKWPFCDEFVGSALMESRYNLADLSGLATITHFRATSVYLESDPCCRIPGSFAHSVLDADRFRRKKARVPAPARADA